MMISFSKYVKFVVPKSIKKMTVDGLTGLLPTKNCPGQLRSDIFAPVNIPTDTCDKVYTTATIDTISKKLATDLTPEETKKVKTFIVLHSEFPDRPNWENPVIGWAKARGYFNPPPREYDDIHVEKNKPSITITSPANGSTASGNFTVTVSVNAPKGVKMITYYIDGESVGATTASPFSITLNTGSEAGEKTLTATILDKIYFTATTSIALTFSPDTQPPNETTNFTAVTSELIVTLSWTNPADFDFDHIEIYRSTDSEFSPNESNLITTIIGTPNQIQSFIDQNLPAGTYYYIIRTFDKVGNFSAGVSSFAIVS